MLAREVGEKVPLRRHYTLDGKETVVEDGWQARWTQTEKNAAEVDGLRKKLSDRESELNDIRKKLAQALESGSSAEVEDLQERLFDTKVTACFTTFSAVILLVAHVFRSRG